MAFGSILEGPDATQLKMVVEQALPFLFKLMHDPSVNVRDTAAWTIGRVCELIPDAAVAPTNLQHLLTALVSGLTAEPRVAANVCWAFSSLAEAAYEMASQVWVNSILPLSSQYSTIVCTDQRRKRARDLLFIRIFRTHCP